MANGDNNSGNPFSRQDVQRAEQMTFQARSLTEELKDQLGVRSRLNETDKAQLNLSREIQRSAALNTVELGNQGQISRQLAKDQKTLLAVQREKLAAEVTVGKTQAVVAKNIVKHQKTSLELQDKLLNASQAESVSLQQQLKNSEKDLKTELRKANAETQRLAVLMGMEEAIAAIIQQRQAEDDIQKDINDKMGVAGALVKGTGALMERLGMRSGIFNDAMKASKDEMQRMAEEATRIDETTGDTLEKYTKTQIMAAGIEKLLRGFGKALFDPFTMLTAIFKAFLDVNKAAVEFTRLTGQGTGTLNLVV